MVICCCHSLTVVNIQNTGVHDQTVLDKDRPGATDADAGMFIIIKYTNSQKMTESTVIFYVNSYTLIRLSVAAFLIIYELKNPTVY